jgi:hypothetical protein
MATFTPRASADMPIPARLQRRLELVGKRATTNPTMPNTRPNALIGIPRIGRKNTIMPITPRTNDVIPRPIRPLPWGLA